jgi:hypothetical protein
MSFESPNQSHRKSPEIEPQPRDLIARDVDKRTQRAIGRTAIATTVQSPEDARVERVKRAAGRAAIRGSGSVSPTRNRSRDRS